jgi:hypothetical protein
MVPHMAHTLKIPYADRHGQLVHVDRVCSGLQKDCFCPVCSGSVIARKGPKLVHHFGHHHKANCQPKTIAHLIAKRMLAEKIRNAIVQRRPLPFVWRCKKCPGTHTGNLVKRASRVEVEFSIPGCRPDIALLSHAGVVVVAIEIVVSHKPEKPACEIYSANGIRLVELDVKSAEDLEAINADMLEVDRVDFCPRPICPKCDIALLEKKLFISIRNCRSPRCQKPMKIAHLSTDGMSCGPEQFTPAEKGLADKLAVVLKNQYSRKWEDAYFANTCAHCGSFIGRHYLPEYCDPGDWDAGTVTGYRCPNCRYRLELPL